MSRPPAPQGLGRKSSPGTINTCVHHGGKRGWKEQTVCQQFQGGVGGVITDSEDAGVPGGGSPPGRGRCRGQQHPALGGRGGCGSSPTDRQGGGERQLPALGDPFQMMLTTRP